MSNEELLVRIDERLIATGKQLDSILTHTTSIDNRLRAVETGLSTLQTEVSDLPAIKTKLANVITWKEQIGGSWKATAVISIVLSFIINGIIQFFVRD